MGLLLVDAQGYSLGNTSASFSLSTSILAGDWLVIGGTYNPSGGVSYGAPAGWTVQGSGGPFQGSPIGEAPFCSKVAVAADAGSTVTWTPINGATGPVASFAGVYRYQLDVTGAYGSGSGYGYVNINVTTPSDAYGRGLVCSWGDYTSIYVCKFEAYNYLYYGGHYQYVTLQDFSYSSGETGTVVTPYVSYDTDFFFYVLGFQARAYRAPGPGVGGGGDSIGGNGGWNVGSLS